MVKITYDLEDSNIKVMAKVKPIVAFEAWSSNRCLLFVSWQLDRFWLRYSKFHIWPWTFKVKVTAKVKSDGHMWGLEFNQCVCFSFRCNRTIFGRDVANSIFDLENSRSRSWPRSNPMVTFEVLRSIDIFTQLALRRWPNVGIGRHRRDRQPTSRQRWYSVACVATVCWHSVGARRLAYRSLPMFCVWTSVVGIKCFSNKCCRSTRLSIHQLHI